MNAKLDNAPRLTRVFRFLIQRRPAAAVAAMPTIVIISTRTMVAKSVLAARVGRAFRCPILHLPIQWPVIRYRRALVRTVSVVRVATRRTVARSAFAGAGNASLRRIPTHPPSAMRNARVTRIAAI